ncbi:hypothetical protein CEY16_03950 [Halalkalibacillus sediminis]|uniref:Peptidase M20 n=1 Tax=Halalkalibacillus sediminis TaxID=2018042 RepID=A0A2I0QX45_9BACI|nr:M20/M25/M40 family metallo-hydrolase [Halalkalibacillus sediminis]PKR78917.1 hypothetical protein CEY16_03950 [Halalkalibacillus sediminis]
MKWQTKAELVRLLDQLVSFKSVTGSEDEIAIVDYIYQLLQERDYFNEHPDHLRRRPIEDGRQFLTALVKKPEVKQTIILVSHIDVVDVDDYGSLKPSAFRVKELTEEFVKDFSNLPEEIKRDLKTGEWLFGRGTMDMKAGTALQLSMLEKAMNGEWDGNILQLVVPDEEANSIGMIEAVEELKKIQAEYDLDYKLCLNCEPMFRQYPGDEQTYFYTGSLGKLLPGFFCYGKETHVGEPFHGLNANLITSYLNEHLELNELFIEEVENQITPPPVSLMNRDLKDQYSVQTPLTAVSMYNVFYMEQTIDDIRKKLFDVMNKTKSHVEQHMREKASIFYKDEYQLDESTYTISVMDYDMLYEAAVERHGAEEVQRRQRLLIHDRSGGDRDFSTVLTQDLAYLCKDLAPMIVLFFSPPFYPAVTSQHHSMIKNILNDVSDYTEKEHERSPEVLSYFSGLSDLSFVGESNQTSDQIQSLTENMPLEKAGLANMVIKGDRLIVPTLNIGPYGKDAHQWTERLEINYSFEQLPKILERTIKTTFKE